MSGTPSDDIEAEYFIGTGPSADDLLEVREAPPDDPTTARLAAADAETVASATGAPVGSSAQSCPLRDRFALEVYVIGEDDKPIADVAIELQKSATEVQLAKSDAKGQVRFEGLAMGEDLKLCLYELDKAAWKVERDETLPEVRKKSSTTEVDWGAPADAEPPPKDRRISEGECTSTLAERYGYEPGALWAAQDDDLRNRRPSKNVLAVGDPFTFPARRRSEQPVECGKSYRVRRLGVPDVLRVRFLDDEGKPRKGLPYLASFRVEDRDDARQGTTNGEGLVVERVPPRATTVEVTLGKGEAKEVFLFEIACLDPLDTPSGLKARLMNLGYACDGAPDEIGSVTRRSLKEFQRVHGLKESGESDDATRAKLKEIHLS